MELSNKVEDEFNEVYQEENSSTLINFIWYMSLSCACVLFAVVVVTVLKMLWPTGEKSRSTQQRQTYTPGPTAYVSPVTLISPPNYEFLAPPSYDEAIKKLSSNSQLNIQPILHPITSALDESLNGNSSSGNGNNTTNKNSTAEITFDTSTAITISLMV